MPTAEQSQFYEQLAIFWAPVILQDSDSSNYRADYITKFNYDGNWDGSDNWENLNSFSLPAYVYYWVVESETHWFVGYAFFHPRDWSEICTTANCHENDLEGIVLTIEKDGTTFGQFLLMITVAHIDFFSYIDAHDPNSSKITNGQETVDGDIQFTNGIPIIYIEAKGHGIKGDNRWENNGFPGGDGIVYYYKDIAEEPESGVDLDVGYDLINITDSVEGLWPRRYDFGTTFANYGAFLGNTHGANAANAPWGWDDWNDGAVFKPDFFSDPAHLVDEYHDGFGTFSHTYIGSSFGNVIESFHPYLTNYDRTWTFKIPNASQVLVDFVSVSPNQLFGIDTMLGKDTINVFDVNGTLINEYSGEIQNPSLVLAGNTASIQLISDAATIDWGFYAEIKPTPHMKVDSSQIRQFLPINQTIALTRTIENLSAIDLSWSINEQPQVDWLMITPSSGVISASETQNLSINFTSVGLNSGVYSTTIEITSNDPGQGKVDIFVVFGVDTDGTFIIDVDDNGKVDGLTDAILIMRYSFGVRGNELIQDAVATDCNRCSVESIEAFLKLVFP